MESDLTKDDELFFNREKLEDVQKHRDVMIQALSEIKTTILIQGIEKANDPTLENILALATRGLGETKLPHRLKAFEGYGLC